MIVGLYYVGRMLLGIAVKIVNVVATAALVHPVDLASLPFLFRRTVIYDPSAYPPPAPAYFKSRDMQGKVSIFPSGKMISVGTKSEEEARQELTLVAKTLNTSLKTEPKIQNIVATANLGLKVDLYKMPP